MVVSFVQRPDSMRLRSYDPYRISLVTNYTCRGMVTHEGCSGRNVTKRTAPVVSQRRALRRVAAMPLCSANNCSKSKHGLRAL